MIQFFSTYDNVFYTIAAICFILGLKKLSHPKTARKGNFIAIMDSDDISLPSNNN